jgi:hypothetical protein
VKEIAVLFLASAVFSLGCRVLLRMQKPANAGPLPDDQRPCFETLRTLLGAACTIDCQVRLSDLFEVRPERGRQPLFRLTDGLHLDFLLADAASGLPLCGIALDDHLPRDPRIDRLFATHDLLLLRIPREHLADPATLRAAMARLARPAPRPTPSPRGARESG